MIKLTLVVRKNRTLRAAEPPASLQEWMERTGLNATVLLRLLSARGCPMTKGTLSSIVSKSRRCSLTKAIVLNEITGVPVKNLIQWPPRMGEAVGETDPAVRKLRTVPVNA